MLNIEIEKSTVRVQPYTNKKGQPATLSFQEAWVFLVGADGKAERYPSKLEFIVPRDERGEPQPYAAGHYQLHPSAIYIDQNGRLAANMRLTPQKQRVPA